MLNKCMIFNFKGMHSFMTFFFYRHFSCYRKEREREKEKEVVLRQRLASILKASGWVFENIFFVSKLFSVVKKYFFVKIFF